MKRMTERLASDLIIRNVSGSSTCHQSPQGHPLVLFSPFLPPPPFSSKHTHTLHLSHADTLPYTEKAEKKSKWLQRCSYFRLPVVFVTLLVSSAFTLRNCEVYAWNILSPPPTQYSLLSFTCIYEFYKIRIPHSYLFPFPNIIWYYRIILLEWPLPYLSASPTTPSKMSLNWTK